MKLGKFKIIGIIKDMFSSSKEEKEINKDYAVIDREIECAAPVRKSSFDRNLDRLKSIYLHTRKFRVKKKLNKRISNLENIKLLEIREI